MKDYSKVYLLNGPPRCGKDTIARGVKRLIGPDIEILRFADCLKEMTHRLYDTPMRHPGAYESLKDTPLDIFHGLTPRQAYISLGQKYIKQVHGMDYFGKEVLRRIRYTPDYESKVFIIPDCGFIEEIIPLLDHFSPSSISLIHVYRDGYTFNEDSRNYIMSYILEDMGIVVREPIYNDSSVDITVKKFIGYLEQYTNILEIS